MKGIAATVIVTLLVAPALAAQSSRTSPDDLLTQVRAEDAKKVLRQLWSKQNEFDRVLAGIESGKPKWLRLAAELRSAADGGASLSLDYAVARAIPHNPAGVLSLIDHGFPLDMVCTSPFIEPEPGIAERYERSALLALGTVKGALASVASRCAANVRLPKGSWHGA